MNTPDNSNIYCTLLSPFWIVLMVCNTIFLLTVILEFCNTGWFIEASVLIQTFFFKSFLHDFKMLNDTSVGGSIISFFHLFNSEQ